MNIPGYDAYILRGPEERPDPETVTCETCRGFGHVGFRGGLQYCPECDGTGEIEVTPDEPDGDCAFELARDATGEEWP